MQFVLGAHFAEKHNITRTHIGQKEFNIRRESVALGFEGNLIYSKDSLKSPKHGIQNPPTN